MVARRLKYVAAHPFDAWLVMWWMGVVEVGVHAMALPKLAALMGSPLATAERAAGPGRSPQLTAAELRRLKLLDALARRWPFGGGPCLRQALVAGRLLRRHHPMLRIGAALDDTEVVGHAWLEIGVLELGRSDDFSTLVASPSP